MIKFIPFEEDVVATPAHVFEIGNNAASRILAERLDLIFGGRKCKEHPDFENKIYVDALNKNVSVKDCCCDIFREELDEIVRRVFPSSD